MKVDLCQLAKIKFAYYWIIFYLDIQLCKLRLMYILLEKYFIASRVDIKREHFNFAFFY